MMRASQLPRADGNHGTPKFVGMSERTGLSTDDFTPGGGARKNFAASAKAFQSERYGNSTDESDYASNYMPGHKKVKRRHDKPAETGTQSEQSRSASPQLNSDSDGKSSNVERAPAATISSPHEHSPQTRGDEPESKETKTATESTTPLPTGNNNGSKNDSVGAVNTNDGKVLGTPPLYSSPPKKSTISGMSDHLGSPMTHQILGRQSHTRHASIDVGGGFSLERFGQMQKSSGRRSAKKETPSNFTPTINEDAPFEGTDQSEQGNTGESMSRDTPSRSNNLESFYSDDYGLTDEESSTMSSSGSSTSSIDSEYPEKVRVKTAKYVVLTLRQALVNSLVIIAVGCLGFWFIEDFSFVDSKFLL